MNINYEYYRIFYYAARFSNLTQAADYLHNSQPGLSRTIRLLEEELGCRLMIRSNRGITLTPEGQRLYAHLRIAIEQIQAAEDELTLSKGLQDGIVTIGASETALHMHLLPVLKAFKETYPGIHIRIQNNLTLQAVEAVKNGVVDFAVITTPVEIEKPLISYPIIEFRDILIGGPAYQSLAAAPITLAQLSKYPLVCLGEDTVTYHFYENFYRMHQLNLRPELQAATTDQILPMILNNLGVGFIPEVFVKDALAKHLVHQIPLAEEIPVRQTCFVEHENHPLSIAATELKKLLLH